MYRVLFTSISFLIMFGLYLLTAYTTTDINHLLWLLCLMILISLIVITSDIINHINDKFDELKKANDELVKALIDHKIVSINYSERKHDELKNLIKSSKD